MDGGRKRYWLASVSIAALAGVTPAATVNAGPATATWSGFYIGIHGGAVRQESTARDLDRFGEFIVGAPFFPESVSQGRTGGLAGFHTGYNWQSGRIVYGVEADFAGAFGTASDVTFTADAFYVPEFIQRYSTELKWLSTFRARVGVDVNATTLVYATGGLAVARIRNRWGQGDTVGTIEPAFAFQFVDDSTRLGWTAGGGVEHRFTPNWSVRAEGFYVDAGKSKTVSHTFASSGGTDFGVFHSQWENTMIVGRVGVTYHWVAGN